ncbi:uncharacterized protein LOC111711395 [Eurytemora carolleeae]|uniref:uncharacterized protein LOC111711395 n=1 Tax=Eurytemora carolleeae TaxID=1294199 RepID=UPI000C7927D4|nr:uncharacterized protein LOC111711395 [Eurytemora carolleeae]|eukprot:XP_023341511.1 uncharacterized protein LOC111711395 [Eurytemora affinis]
MLYLISSFVTLSYSFLFSELQERGETEGVARVKRPSYVGISNSLNGYTPYAPYRTAQDYGRKISPPLHFPPQLPPSLDSVSLVLTQDGFQKSLQEFQETMRDINMGRPESGDITDNGSIMTGSEEFYPRSHIKQVIQNGDSKSVHTLTQFHSSHSTQAKPNLVSKQIERLYGSDSLAQIRLTSPEPQDRSPGSIRSPARNGSPDFTPPERKLSGGFFSKRFGITKMKDHSTLPAAEKPKEVRPLKVRIVLNTVSLF